MTMLSNVNTLKKKLKKLFFGVAIFCLLAISAQINTLPHIFLKGLFRVLKIDDIGFGQALLHSKWIENMYQYGEGKPHKQVEGDGQNWSAEKKNDAVADLVRRLWFRRDENHTLEPQKEPSEAFENLDVNRFGVLINWVYTYVWLETARQERIKASICKYTKKQKEIKKFKLPKLFGKLNEIKKKLEKELFQEQNKELQQKDELRVLEESKGAFEQEKIRVSQATQEIKENYKQLIQAKNQEKDILVAARKKDFTQVQESSRVDYLHQEMTLVLARYIKVLAKETGIHDYDKQIAGLEKSVLERQELSKRLDELEKPQVDLGQISKVIKNLEKQEQRLSKELQELSFLPKYIRPALDKCKRGRYASRTVEGILWAFFFHKIDKLSSLPEKIEAIKSCLANISPEFKNQDLEEGDLKECYAPKKFAEYDQEIKKLALRDDTSVSSQDGRGVHLQVDKIMKDYDLALHYFISLIAGSKFPPRVTMGSFGYEFEEGKLSIKRANCHETATLDALGILWYNRETKAFDDALIKDGPGFTRLRQALKYLYLADNKKIKVDEYTCEFEGRKFTSIEKIKKFGKITEEEVENLDISQVPVSYINRSEIKQEFMNIVSGLQEQGVIYCSEVSQKGKIFELETDVRNVLKIFNYFYGTSAQNFEELGDKQKGISSDLREITFEKENEKNTPNDITIGMQDEGSHLYVNMVLEVGTGHTELSVPGRKKTSLIILKEGFVKALLERVKDQRCSTIFTLLTSSKLLKNKELNLNLSLPMLQLVYYSLFMKRARIKKVIIEDLLVKHAEHYDVCKEMIRNLIEKFPVDDASLGSELAKVILKSEFCNKDKESFFYELVKSVVINPRFYSMRIFGGDGVSVEKMLRVAIEQNQRDIALLITGHEKFINPTGWQAAEILSTAIKQGYKTVAANIAANPGFSAWGLALEYALERDWKDVAKEIIAYERFSSCYLSKALSLAIKKKYKNLALAIVTHEKFYGTDIADAFEGALKKNYRKIAEFMTKDSKFSLGSLGKYKWIDILLLALRKKYEQVALNISKHPQFDVNNCNIDKALLSAIKRGYETVAFSIINNEKFIVNLGIRTEDIFKAGLEKNYKELVLAIIEKPGFQASRVVEIIKIALEKDELEIALAIAKHETFRGHKAGHALKEALKKPQYYEVALAIVTNKFFDASDYGVMDAFKTSLENDYKEVVLAIVKNQKFDASGYGIDDALILALEKGEQYKEIATIIVNHEKFNGNGYNMGKALSWALRQAQEGPLKQGYQDIAAKIIGAAKFKDWEKALEFAFEQNWKTVAWEIFEHPQFDMQSRKLGKALVLMLMNSEFEDMAKKTIENSDFKDWSGALSSAILQNLPKIALELLEHPACDLSDGVGYTLGVAIEKGLKDISLKILAHPTLNSETKMGRGLQEALKKEDHDIIAKIIEHEAFDISCDSMGYALAVAMKDKRYVAVVQKILCDPRFNLLADALCFTADEGWKDIALELVKYKEFDFCPGNRSYNLTIALEKIIKQGWRMIALDVVKHPKFNASAKYMYSAVETAVRAGFRDVALAIIEHPTYNINCDNIIYFLNKVAQEQQECAKDVEEVIEFLKQKQEENKKK